MGTAGEGSCATAGGSGGLAERGLGALPGVVRAGATLSVLAVLAAVLLALLPVSSTVSDDLDGESMAISCGSVLRPGGEDALADEPRGSSYAAAACDSARTVRMGWSGMAVAGAVVALAFSLLIGGGMAARPTARREAATAPSP